MSAEKPIISISSDDSELAKIISKFNIGRNFNNLKNVSKIASYVLKLKNNKNFYREVSKNSKMQVKILPKTIQKD